MFGDCSGIIMLQDVEVVEDLICKTGQEIEIPLICT